MNVLITGPHGLIGSALSARLRAAGHSVTGLSRHPGPGDFAWDPIGPAGPAAPKGLPLADAVVHLAGESIASGRWTAARKQAILDSRVNGTRLLAETLAAQADQAGRGQRPASITPRLASPEPRLSKPKTLVVASAIGYYGDRPGEELSEDSSSGGGFLAEVCRQWEAAAEPARVAGIRVVHARFGMVLSPTGGALAPLLLTTRLGVGGPVGSGRQVWSWIALDDVAGALAFLLDHDEVSGPVNVVSPQPVEQREFARTLGRVLHRPSFMPLPGPAARLVLGEMANELLLPSQRVRPAKLEVAGFRFAYPELEEALRGVVGPEYPVGDSGPA